MPEMGQVDFLETLERMYKDSRILFQNGEYYNKSFPICRTISYYIEAYTLINRSFEFHFMKTV